MAPIADALVVDASVAVKWHLVDEEHSDMSALLLRQFMIGALEIVAPSHIRFEVTSAITVATTGRESRLTVEEGREAIEEFLAIGITTVDRNDLILAAFRLVHEFGVSIYDALYLAVARDVRVPLLTADRRFYHRTSHLSEVIWIGDYARVR